MGGFINMPYYVYRVPTDNRDNQLIDSFKNYKDASKIEEDWKSIRHLEGHDYFITIVNAENKQEADIKANNLRPHPKLL